MHLTLYFSEWCEKFHKRQVQNKLVKSKRDASRQTKDSPKSFLQCVGVDETPRTGRKVQGASWSGHHGFRGLKWGQDILELPWKMDLVDIESGVGGRRPNPPRQAEPVTLGMIECLEIFIADLTTSMLAKKSCNSIPFLLLCSDEGRISTRVLDWRGTRWRVHWRLRLSGQKSMMIQNATQTFLDTNERDHKFETVLYHPPRLTQGCHWQVLDFSRLQEPRRFCEKRE